MSLPPHTPARRRADVVVVGAGFAGLATAAALAQQGVRRIVVLEREAVPGYHASGRNAAMARRVIADAHLSRLATRSVALIDELGAHKGCALIDHSGGLLIGGTGAIDKLVATCEEVPALQRDYQRLGPEDVERLVPALAGAPCEAAIHTRGCGVADIHALLTAYLGQTRARGGEVLFSAPVTGISVEGGRVQGVVTPLGEISTPLVVNAAGFGANRLAELAGLSPMPLDPVRRHLFVTTPNDLVARDSPFVWNVSQGFYFRTEGAGLLMCACDETSWPCEDPPVDPGAREALAVKFSQLVPGLSDAQPTRGWCGLRVMTPDGRFVIGSDPRISGFFWVAGLGGHGMTTSAGVGELAAMGVLEGQLPGGYASAFAPERFLQ